MTSATATATFAWDLATSTPSILSDGTSDFVYGPTGMVVEQVGLASGTPEYLVHDQIGSTRLVTDAAGTVVGTSSYGPYGTAVTHGGAATSPIGYAGGFTDASTGLSYLVNRYYTPGTGSFLSVDPLVAMTTAPYVYATGDAVNGVDPFGLFTLNPLSAVAKAVAAVGNAVSNAASNVGHAYAHAFDTVRHAVAHYTDNVVYSSAVTWFNKHINPAFQMLMGYRREWQAVTNGCPFATVLSGAAQGVLGAVNLAGVAGGAVELGGAALARAGAAAAEGGASVGAETESGIVQSFRPLEGDAPAGPSISLEQARAAAERNGLDLSNVDLKYESPDSPGYRASGYGYSSFTFSGEPYVNAAGNYEITLQNAGLASEPDAVATIAHEWAHLYLVGPEDHAGAEEFAQQLMEGYVP